MDCPRQHTVPLERSTGGTFTLRPAGSADTYDVTLSGRGDGDLFVSFRWTTTQDGPMPAPEARLAVVADHDGEPDSYGVELVLSNLASTPAQSSATISVTSAEGDSITFDATRAPQCIAEGTVYWDGPDDQGLAAAHLGEPPFTYEVKVTLDGISYSATATWPIDQIEGNEPSVALDLLRSCPHSDPRSSVRRRQQPRPERLGAGDLGHQRHEHLAVVHRRCDMARPAGVKQRFSNARPPDYSRPMLRALRFFLLVVIMFLVLGLIVAIGGPETGPLEKGVLAAVTLGLFAVAVPVRRLGSV